jgi:hypothetical protein
MKQRPKSPSLKEKSLVPTADASAVLQAKVWLTGITPMGMAARFGASEFRAP